MCAMMPMLRILVRSIGLEAAMTAPQEPVASATEHERIDVGTSRREKSRESTRRGGKPSVAYASGSCDAAPHQAKCEKALLASAILMVFSRLVMASPSRR